MDYVTPDYLNGNKTGQYKPEIWVDEVKDSKTGAIIQEGTPMDAEHFNHMEQGIHNNSLMAGIMLEQLMDVKRVVTGVDGETIELTLTNSKDFYFNNSVKTVALSKMRDSLDYRVFTEIQGKTVNVGDVVVYDKQLNGFKIAYTGSAASVTVKCYVQGGVAI